MDSIGLISPTPIDLQEVQDLAERIWHHVEASVDAGVLTLSIAGSRLYFGQGWDVPGPAEDPEMDAALRRCGITTPHGYSIDYRDQGLARELARQYAAGHPLVIDTDHGFVGASDDYLAACADPEWRIDAWPEDGEPPFSMTRAMPPRP